MYVLNAYIFLYIYINLSFTHEGMAFTNNRSVSHIYIYIMRHTPQTARLSRFSSLIAVLEGAIVCEVCRFQGLVSK